jgi:class 3 adenylate cyclase
MALTKPGLETDQAQLVQELAYLCHVAQAAHQHNQRLQALIRPLLSQTTWREATWLARRNGHTLPTETREMSILRLDIAGFTELMDSQPLDHLLAALDVYLTRLTPIVHDHQGDIDKYLGDGFLAVFANPDESVQAGCALQQVAAKFNHEQSVQGGLIFSTRLGIDSGPVALTTLGSPDRQDRTVIGPAVNLAERLQAQATPGRVWMSQATFERLQDRSGCRRVGPLQIKGRSEPVIIYEKLLALPLTEH